MKNWLMENVDTAVLNLMLLFSCATLLGVIITIVVVVCKIALYQWGS